MGSYVPSQAYDHSVVIVKGNNDLMHRLDFAAAPTADEVIYAGSLVSLDSDTGLFVAGVDAGSVASRPMPMVAIQGYNEFDVLSDYGNVSGGVMSAYVLTGGYEIETTEAVTASYKVNDLLTAATASDIGKVKKATVAPYSTEVIVGCVARPTRVNQYGKSVLSFWSMFLPATDVTPTT